MQHTEEPIDVVGYASTNFQEEPEDNGPLTKKKPRSQKQIDAFKIAMEKRAENVASRKHNKLIVASELLVKNHVAASPKKTKPIKEPTVTPDSSSEDEEIIIVKSKPKPKKKIKKIIIESSESDSEGSDGGQTPAPAPPQSVSVQRNREYYPFNSVNFFV
jgi:hypothetical protein